MFFFSFKAYSSDSLEVKTSSLSLFSVKYKYLKNILPLTPLPKPNPSFSTPMVFILPLPTQGGVIL